MYFSMNSSEIYKLAIYKVYRIFIIDSEIVLGYSYDYLYFIIIFIMEYRLFPKRAVVHNLVSQLNYANCYWHERTLT